MSRLLITLLMASLLAGCAAQQTATSMTDRPRSDGNLCPPYVRGEPWKPCPYEPFRPSMNLGQAVTDLATIPLRLPDAMISNYPAGGRVYCRSWTYKDQYHASCY